MENQNLNDKLLDLLKIKIPQKKQRIVFLTDLLKVERGSVYRRVRGDVPFTFQEAASIAKELGLSLDQLVESSSPAMYNPYTEKPQGINTSREEANYQILVNYVNKMGEVCTQSNSEHGHVYNFMPLGLSLPYPYLLKFIIYRFLHLFGDNAMLHTFHTHTISKKIQEEFYRMEYYLLQAENTFYIWDPSIIKHTVDNIHYFMDMGLIQPKDALSLKKELFRFLDDVEAQATAGKLRSGKRFSLYISGIHIDFTHSYICSETRYMSILMTYILQAITLFDKQSCMQVKNRVNCMRKLSTLISEVGEKERIQFFGQQREVVDLII